MSAGQRRRPRGYVPIKDIPAGAVTNPEPIQTPTQVLVNVTATVTAPAEPEAAHEPTQVIEGVTPSLAQDLADGLQAAELGLTEDLGNFAGYSHEPIPDLYSADPADRTEWFLIAGGPEPLFEGTVADLSAEWLLDTSLPVPVRTAPEPAEDTADSGPAPDEIPGSGPAGPDINPVPEAARPPAAEEAGPAAEQASPEASGTVSTEDEPAAEQDCGEGGDA